MISSAVCIQYTNVTDGRTLGASRDTASRSKKQQDVVTLHDVLMAYTLTRIVLICMFDSYFVVVNA